MFLRLLDGPDDFVLLQGNRMLQSDLDWCAHIDEKVVRTEQQCHRREPAGYATDSGPNDRISGFRAEYRRASGCTEWWPSHTPRGKVGRDRR
jgi:hypothetical protein